MASVVLAEVKVLSSVLLGYILGLIHLDFKRFILLRNTLSNILSALKPMAILQLPSVELGAHLNRTQLKHRIC